ncbi:GNAT family N-acetyltransferase [Halobacillus salinus]|uniref:GNAT family N-acetyltransferase n=1 Tax=Halobacillus salinus TaxID=192814 RepID=UPI0009A81136|nr:GNAT family protein [Halobacillus salinus]
MEILEENKVLYLREVTQDDWSLLHEYASNEDVCKFQPWGPNTEEDSKFFIAQAIRDRNKRHRSRFVFAIVLKENNQVVGNIEMNITDWDGVGEIGFVIHHGHWGNGYAKQAVCLMLKHSFDKCELHRVAAVSDPNNLASIRVLERVGMIKEGVLRKDLYIKGHWRDSVVFSLLENEWDDKQRKACDSN